MLRTRRLAAGLAIAALAVAGCGGDDESGGNGGNEPAATAAPEETAQAAANGKELFTNTCGGCHTLSDAGTNGQVGPNLDDLAPDAERVLAAIAAGPGPMPANLYEGEDADAVAEYVAGAAGQ